MKTKAILFSLTFLFGMMSMAGCKDSSNGVTVFPDAAIIKTLPLIRSGSFAIRESRVIQSQQELLEILTQEQVDTIAGLKNIDFTKYTLLLGYGTYPNEVTTTLDLFTKTGNSSYEYLLKVSGFATRPDVFRYGIVVPKLPEEAKVDFEIKTLNLQ